MKWYDIQAKAGETHATIHIYDEVGAWGISGKRFAEELKALSADTIDLYINSPGGSVFEGLLVFNALRNSGKTINVKVMGIAASIASYIAMAGDTIEMPKNTFQFVHNAIGLQYGNADDFREFAEVLDKITESIKATYAKRTGLDGAKLQELFDKESYLTADECLALGLCDDVTDEIEAKARFDVDRPDLPENVLAIFKAAKMVKPPVQAPVAVAPAASLAARISEACKAAGLEAHAPVFLTDKDLDSFEKVEASIAVAVEIKEICALVSRPDDATDYIAKRRTVAEARESLQTVLAANDASRHTSNVITPKASGPASPSAPSAHSTASIWANVRKQEAAISRHPT